MKTTNIKRCPPECVFDWPSFHKQLDWAMAHFIEDTDGYPSKTSILDFATYSHTKVKLSKGGTP